MPGLINIAPMTETADIRGNLFTVNGLEAEVVAGLLVRFPEIRKMWDTRKFDVQAFMKLSKPAIAYIVASCIDGLDEENAGNLSLGERADILAKILRISMPKGVGPFVELMEALGVTSGPSGSAPDTKSPKPSKSSSPAGTPEPGNIRRAS